MDRIFAKAIENRDEDIIREWCTRKAVKYFLMLHYHTRDRMRVVLQHIERKEDLKLKIGQSISYRSVHGKYDFFIINLIMFMERKLKLCDLI